MKPDSINPKGDRRLTVLAWLIVVAILSVPLWIQVGEYWRTRPVETTSEFQPIDNEMIFSTVISTDNVVITGIIPDNTFVPGNAAKKAKEGR